MRIWKVTTASGEDKDHIELALLLNNNLHAGSAEGPRSLTSFDWNQADPSLLVTASLDNSCTVWSLETGQAVAKSSMYGITNCS